MKRLEAKVVGRWGVSSRTLYPDGVSWGGWWFVVVVVARHGDCMAA